MIGEDEMECQIRVIRRLIGCLMSKDGWQRSRTKTFWFVYLFSSTLDLPGSWRDVTRWKMADSNFLDLSEL